MAHQPDSSVALQDSLPTIDATAISSTLTTADTSNVSGMDWSPFDPDVFTADPNVPLLATLSNITPASISPSLPLSMDTVSSLAQLPTTTTTTTTTTITTTGNNNTTAATTPIGTVATTETAALTTESSNAAACLKGAPLDSLPLCVDTPITTPTATILPQPQSLQSQEVEPVLSSVSPTEAVAEDPVSSVTADISKWHFYKTRPAELGPLLDSGVLTAKKDLVSLFGVRSLYESYVRPFKQAHTPASLHSIVPNAMAANAVSDPPILAPNSQDALSSLSTKAGNRIMEPSYISYISDLPGTPDLAPDSELRDLLFGPRKNDPIRPVPFDKDTLDVAFSLSPGQIPGFQGLFFGLDYTTSSRIANKDKATVSTSGASTLSIPSTTPRPIADVPSPTTQTPIPSVRLKLSSTGQKNTKPLGAPGVTATTTSAAYSTVATTPSNYDTAASSVLASSAVDADNLPSHSNIAASLVTPKLIIRLDMRSESAVSAEMKKKRRRPEDEEERRKRKLLKQRQRQEMPDIEN
ncbi:hypothetical protein BASA50_007196 [Batrachochytrium salamandrivorans]|uniref:Mediator of RNA polymerase II transcription subunit 19 n=1 Tax=Batrachochytrium salamandrivorans TaxID=1357716 RepID=A0ABQ8F7L9_9FUNG|nr:hypothetical protein BASA50_007196 [Batrachochytrium salamandrivorans]